MCFTILCVMVIFNIIMLLANVWLRVKNEKTLAEIKARLGGFEHETS